MGFALTGIVTVLVADHIRECCPGFGMGTAAVVVRPWSWTLSCPPETRDDVFEALLKYESNELRTYWDLDELLRDYVSRHGSR